MYDEKKGRTQGVGNLSGEIEEIKKIILDNNDMEIYASSTRTCGGFLTIYCC